MDLDHCMHLLRLDPNTHLYSGSSCVAKGLCTSYAIGRFCRHFCDVKPPLRLSGWYLTRRSILWCWVGSGESGDSKSEQVRASEAMYGSRVLTALTAFGAVNSPYPA
jgi:hypothetical protein